MKTSPGLLHIIANHLPQPPARFCRRLLLLCITFILCSHFLMIMASQLFRRSFARPLTIGALGLTNAFVMSTQKSNCDFDGMVIPSSSNPLMKKDGLPLFKEIKPEHAVPAVEHDLKKMKHDFEAFENKLSIHKGKPLNYSAVVEELEKMDFPLSYSWGVVRHLMSVKNSDDLRAAHKTLQPSVIEVQQKTGQSLPLFHALSNLMQYPANEIQLDSAQKRIVSNSLLSMKYSGVDLEPETKEKFNKLQLELADLSTKFSNNILDSTKKFQLKLTNPDDVKGLPDSVLGLLAQNAKTHGAADATAEDGPWLVTLDFPSYFPCMQHLQSREIREKIYRAYVTRASEAEHDNSQIIQRILQIKLEMAKILGYQSHAEKSLKRKMASQVDAVNNLISMLREKSYPAAQKELEQLQAFANANGLEGKLALWDVSYWSERQREKLYEYSEEELRPYFALPKVLEGMFSLANRLFGIRIVKHSGHDVEVWHPDVQFFDVFDEETNEHIASFYLDPYSRPAEKRGGAWMDTCIGKSKVMHRIPVAYLVCNGSPPVGDKPSLMSFGEVETLFHEFGHGLQHMLTRVEHADAAGINLIEWDAVELPSQFMENWCYDEKTFYSFARHYQTNEPLPKELFEKIKNAKNYHAALQMIRQLYFGAMDMELHSTYDPNNQEGLTPFDIQRKLAPLYTVIPPLQEDRFLCSFSHIFAGGYSAGYYSYKWAEVMSADAFAAFEEAGLDNEEQIVKVGRRFRETVLALGGSKHPSEVFQLFRGRDPSPNALLRHSGLIEENVKASQ